MRLTVLAFLLAGAAHAQFSNGYLRRHLVTLNRTFLPNTSSSSNYVATYTATGSDLDKWKATSAGGCFARTDSFDLRVETTGGTQIPFDLDVHDQSTGDLTIHAKYPTVNGATAGSDSTVYVYCNKPSQSTSEEDEANTWSDYVLVSHMGTASTISISDVAGGRTFTNVNAVTASAGKIGGAGEFSVDRALTVASDAALNPTSAITISAWVFSPTGALDNNGYVVGREFVSSVVPYALNISVNPGATAGFASYNGGWNTANWGISNNPLGDNVWSYVAGVFTGTVLRSYVCTGSNVSQANQSSHGSLPTNTSLFKIGAYDASYISATGPATLIDEVRVSSSARSADLLSGDCNLQANPATYWTVGAADDAPITTTIRRYRIIQ